MTRWSRVVGRTALWSAVIAAQLCFAQFSSSVQGVVLDASGGSIPNAAVTLVNSATQVSRGTTSDHEGNYRIVSLAPGQYRLTVESPGFVKTAVEITLETNKNLNVPVNMTVASSKSETEVTAAAPAVDTADSRNQQTLEARELAELPLQGRNMMGLITMAPGVTGRGLVSTSVGSPTDNFGTETFFDASGNGRSASSNQFILDGLDVTSSTRPGVVNLMPDPEAIQEVSIQVNTYTVDYSRASSIQMVMTSRSGTDQYHGLVSDYFTYQNLWAGTEFIHHYTPFHTHNLSANVGGPMIPHHQAFFFFNVEPLRSAASTGNNLVTYESPDFTAFAKQAFPNTLGTKLLSNYAPTGATTAGSARQRLKCSRPGPARRPAGHRAPSTCPVQRLYSTRVFKTLRITVMHCKPLCGLTRIGVATACTEHISDRM